MKQKPNDRQKYAKSEYFWAMKAKNPKLQIFKGI